MTLPFLVYVYWTPTQISFQKQSPKPVYRLFQTDRMPDNGFLLHSVKGFFLICSYSTLYGFVKCVHQFLKTFWIRCRGFELGERINAELEGLYQLRIGSFQGGDIVENFFPYFIVHGFLVSFLRVMPIYSNSVSGPGLSYRVKDAWSWRYK